MGIKVLLVDDDRAFIDVLSKRIGRRGFIIETALSGAEAIDKLKNDSSIDVVILDVKMPQMDGIEALKKIKADHPLVQVIMLSGHGTVETAIEGMRQGALDYLMKPCDLVVLIAKVEEAKARKTKQEEKIAEAEVINTGLSTNT
jgi:DNA-binding NtrC family response regulator